MPLKTQSLRPEIRWAGLGVISWHWVLKGLGSERAGQPGEKGSHIFLSDPKTGPLCSQPREKPPRPPGLAGGPGVGRCGHTAGKWLPGTVQGPHTNFTWNQCQAGGGGSRQRHPSPLRAAWPPMCHLGIKMLIWPHGTLCSQTSPTFLTGQLGRAQSSVGREHSAFRVSRDCCSWDVASAGRDFITQAPSSAEAKYFDQV